MKVYKYIIINIFIFHLLAFQLNAQQDPGYSQYMLNPLVFNPAYAGTRDMITMVFTDRRQWIGLDSEVATQNASLQYPLTFDFSSYQDFLRGRPSGSNVALGWTHDQIGAIKTNELNLDYSYLFTVAKQVRMSLGLRVSAANQVIDYSNLSWLDPDDPLLTKKINSTRIYNTGLGIYAFKRNHWYLGLSIPKIIKSKALKEEASYYDINPHIYYFVTGGAVFDLNRNLKLRTTSLLRYAQANTFSAEVSAHLMLSDRFWAGGSLRIKDSFTLSIVADVKKSLKLAYSYDFGTSELSRFHKGSHEIIIIWDFLPSSVNDRYRCYF